jgi:putative endonuclease
MTSKHNTVLYVGVTNDLWRCVSEHNLKLQAGFTSRYNVNKLVYYEVFDDIEEAIAREKQLKGGLRKDKVKLIAQMNSEWNDLCKE